MENSTPVNTKRLKILGNRSEYIITSVSQVVMQKFTEIGSSILGGQIGEVLVFFYLQTHKQFLSPRLQVTNMDRIERINADYTWFQVQKCLLGVSTMINYC